MTAIVWTDGSAVPGLGWAFRCVGSLFGGDRTSRNPMLAGDAPPFYLTEFHAKLRHRSDLRKAVEMALPQLMPVATDELTIYARCHPGNVQLCAFRTVDFNQWWSKQSRRGATRPITVADGWVVHAPAAIRINERRQFAVMMALIVAMGAILSVYFSYVANREEMLEALVEQEQRLRSAAVEAAAKSEEADIWASLRQARAKDRLPANVLVSMAELSRTTPAGSFWTQMEWTPEKVLLVGRSVDPVGTLTAFSELKRYTAAFSSPVRAADAGLQEFQIALTAKATAQ